MKNAKKTMPAKASKKAMPAKTVKPMVTKTAKPTYEQKVSVINEKDNLLFLCPNCHWEFDNVNAVSR